MPTAIPDSAQRAVAARTCNSFSSITSRCRHSTAIAAFADKQWHEYLLITQQTTGKRVGVACVGLSSLSETSRMKLRNIVLLVVIVVLVIGLWLWWQHHE